MKKCSYCGTICHHTKDYYKSLRRKDNPCKFCYRLITMEGYDVNDREKLLLEISRRRVKIKSTQYTTKVKKNSILNRLNVYNKCRCCKVIYKKTEIKKYKYINDKSLYDTHCNSCLSSRSEKRVKYLIQWRENGGNKILNDQIKLYAKKRRKEDSFFRLKQSIRCLISNSFRSNGYKKKNRTEKILGCDLETFKNHIERQFKNGMTWDNRSEWHIDHIYPMKEAKTEEDVIRLNHYTNLRPLWAKENLSKNASIEEHQMKLPF